MIRNNYFKKTSTKNNNFKKRQTTLLFCPTKMETWSDICPFKKEKLFAALTFGTHLDGFLPGW